MRPCNSCMCYRKSEAEAQIIEPTSSASPGIFAAGIAAVQLAYRGPKARA
jgi:hypothetical protein